MCVCDIASALCVRMVWCICLVYICSLHTSLNRTEAQVVTAAVEA